MTNLKFIVGAYMVIWAIFFGYLFFLNRRLKKAEAALKDLRRPDPAAPA